MTDSSADNVDVAQPSIEQARQEAAEQLARHAGDGLMTLDDYAQRAEAIERAASPQELEEAVRRLPAQAEPAVSAQRPRWLLGILGGTDQRGLWRLSSRLRIVAVLGGVRLDLGQAQPESRESRITIFTLLGGADLRVPACVPIQLSGFTLLGGRSDERPAAKPLAGAPLLRVRHYGALGGVSVKTRSSSRSVAEAIRARRRKPSDGD